MASSVPNSEATQFRAGEEQVEIARKGGIASGKARNYKKEQIENLKMLLDSVSKNGKTYRELINLGLMKGALNGKAENFKALMEYIDDNQQSSMTPIINVNIIDNAELEKSLYDETN